MQCSAKSRWAAAFAAFAAFAAPGTAQEPARDERPPASELRLAFREAEPLPAPANQPVSPPVHLPPIDSASGGRLTLLDVENLAVASHPALREALGRFRAAQGNWLQVGLPPNPAIGYVGDEIGDDGTAGQQGGFVSQQFVTAGKLRLNRAVASREVFAAQQRLEIARLRVLTTVRIYYFEVLAAKRMLTLASRLSDIAAQSTAVSNQRLQALDIPRVSLLQSQVASESAVLLQQQATERYAAAGRRLSNLIGIPSAEAERLEDALLQPLPEFEWTELRGRILGESPQLAELRFAVDSARWAVDRAAAGRVPNVTAQTGVAHDNATGDTVANVQVSMPLPIYDRNQGALAQSYGELAAAQAALEQQELALEQRLTVVLRDYETARQRARQYSDSILPLARETLDLTSAGYREGELDFLSVLTVQQTFAEANLAYLQNLETAWKKWAEIEGLLVEPFADSSN